MLRAMKNGKEAETTAEVVVPAAAAEDVSKERKRRSRSKSNADKIIIFIPNEVIFEILLRIPLENITKFKYVCKSWFTMISFDPVFAKRYLEPIREKIKNSNYAGIITYFRTVFFAIHQTSWDMRTDYKHFFTTPSLDFYQQKVPPTMLRSVNGLVVLMGNDNDDLSYICNPTTGEFRSFPNCGNHLSVEGRRSYGFGYANPSISATSSTNFVTFVYKVIQVTSTCLFYDPNDGDASPIQCSIHTLGSKSWRVIKSPSYPLYGDSVFVDGVMYWLVQTKVVGLVKIMTFDVGSEKFSELAPPIEISLDHGRCSQLMQLVELNGSLCLVDWITKCRRAKELHIWRLVKQGDMADNIMKSNGESCWVREYRINIVALNKDVSNCLQLLQIQDGKILFRWVRDGFFSYDIESQILKSVSARDYPFSAMQTTVYEHSLVFPPM